MATKNPRVVGYVQPDTHAKLKEYMEANGLTESKALDLILSEYFGVSVPRVALSSTPVEVERIEALEKQVAELGDGIVKQIAELGDRLGKLRLVA